MNPGDLIKQLEKAVLSKSTMDFEDAIVANRYRHAAYDETYDAYYDKKTGVWIESACPNNDCLTCKNRPQKHYDSKQ